MVSKKSIKKSQRLEAAANEAFKRFSQASWALSLSDGDEISEPAPASVREQLRAKFWQAAETETVATTRVNLRNVSARFRRGRITKLQIPAVCERIRKS